MTDDGLCYTQSTTLTQLLTCMISLVPRPHGKASFSRGLVTRLLHDQMSMITSELDLRVFLLDQGGTQD